VGVVAADALALPAPLDIPLAYGKIYMTPTPRQIGMRLKRMRKEKGFSQYALAKASGVSRQHIRTLEAGKSDPTVGMLQRLARALGVPVMALLEE
jgi:DNA-binding XRE family transcriptional regulator